MLVDQRPRLPGKSVFVRTQDFSSTSPKLSNLDWNCAPQHDHVESPRPTAATPLAGCGMSRHNDPHITTCLPNRRNLVRSHRHTAWCCHSFSMSFVLCLTMCHSVFMLINLSHLAPRGLFAALRLPMVTMTRFATVSPSDSSQDGWRHVASQQPTADNVVQRGLLTMSADSVAQVTKPPTAVIAHCCGLVTDLCAGLANKTLARFVDSGTGCNSGYRVA